MVRIAFLFFLAAFAHLAGAAEQLNWLQDYNQAVKAANISGKQILIDCVAETCVWCRKMNDEVYSTVPFITFTRSFVLLRINVEDKAAGSQLGRRFNVTTLPALLVVDSSERLLNRISGYVAASDLIRQISSVQGLIRREQTNPNDWESIQLLAEEYLARDMSREAEMRFLKLIRAPISEGSKESAHFSLAMAQFYQRKNTEAVQTLHDYKQMYPQGKSLEDALLLLSQIHLELGERDQARQVLEELLQRFPDSKNAKRAREVLRKL